MKTSKILPLLYLFGLFCQQETSASGQLPHAFSFKQFTNANGLPGETIKAIHQDANGLLWLSVEYQGLVCYDGFNFDLFPLNKNGAPVAHSLDIRDINSDSEGNLWIATPEGILRKSLDPTQFSNEKFQHFSTENSNLASNDIHCILQNHENRILFGTSQGLVLNDNNEFPLVGLAGEKAQAIIEVPAQGYYVGTRNGLFLLDHDFQIVTHWRMPAPELHSSDITTLALDHRNRLWIGSKRGLWVLDILSGNFMAVGHLTQRPTFRAYGIHKITRDLQNRMWVGTTSEGLHIFTPEDDRFTPITPKSLEIYGFQGDQLRALACDHQGLVWIGAKNQGLYQFNHRSETFGLVTENTHLGRGINDNGILSLYETKDKELLIGTRHGGLNIWNSSKQRFFYTDFKSTNGDLRSNRIETITEDAEGTIWLGTIQGLSQLDMSSSTITSYDSFPIKSIHTDQSQKLWLGTRQGFYTFDKKRHIFAPAPTQKPVAALHDYINTIVSGDDEILWIGTQKSGIVKYDKTSGEAIWYHREAIPPFAISTNQVRTLHLDSKNQLWIGTKDQGLLRLDLRYNRLVPTNPTLNNCSIFGILEDSKKRLWLASNKGIIRYDPSKGETQLFGKEYGLQGEAFINSSCYQSASGMFYFGGNNGLNYFDPLQIEKQQRIPQITIKSISSNEGSLTLKSKDKGYKLPHDAQLFIDFILADHAASHQGTFAYQLQGLNEQWIYSGHRNQVTYGNLPPGQYTFRVKGANADLIWSDNIATFDFEILPPVWWTTTAKIIYFLSLILVFYILFRALTFRSRKQHELKILKLENKKTEELTKYKLRFFTNISHEFRTPLTLIFPSAEKLITSQQLDEDERIKHAQVIYKNGQRMLTLLDELMDFRSIQQKETAPKLQLIPVQSTLQQLFEEFYPLALLKNQQMEFHCATEQEYAALDPKYLRKIVGNLISNAIKYTPNNGRICVSVSETKAAATRSIFGIKKNINTPQLEINISDTGIGISHNAIRHIFDRFYRSEYVQTKEFRGSGIGLDLVKSLVEAHHGTIAVKSKLGEGTTFTVKLPLEKNKGASPAKVDDSTLSGHLNPEKKTHAPKPESKHLLIVDDDEELLAQLEELLSPYHQVTACANANDALKIAQGSPQPSLIISDVMMPGTNGLQLCQQLGQNHKTSHIPVILLTARTSQEHQLEGFQAGAVDYLTKPFATNMLLTKIQMHLERQDRLQIYFRKEAKIQPKDLPQNKVEDRLLNQCMVAIETNLDNSDFGVEDLAKAVGMSRTQLFRKLKYHIDQGPLEMIYSIRLKKSIELMQKTDKNIAEIAYATGFSSPSSFSTTFKKHYNVSPTAYAKKLKKQDNL